MAKLREEPCRTEFYHALHKTYEARNYTGLAGRMMTAGHTLAERPFPHTTHFSNVLEVGCGTGEHIAHVRHGFDRYVVTDLSVEFLFISQRALPDGMCGVEFERQDATALTYADNTFDRLVAAHILEHLVDPHLVLREWARVVKPGGTITILLPCDPGLLWETGRAMGPRRAAQENGIPHYDFWMAREHINSIHNLRKLVQFYFPKRRENWFPARVPVSDANLFYVAHLTV